MVGAFVREAGDPETALATWLEEGAPTGVANDILGVGAFPLAVATGDGHEELWRHWARIEPTANYASVAEHEGLVKQEVGRLIAKGFVTVYPSWQAVTDCFGHVVVSKMAALAKQRPDGSTKLRLIIDMLRSHVNAHVRLHERIVLPRITDLLGDALAIQGLTNSDDEQDMMVLDWEDAFHSMGVLPSERPHQIVKGFGGSTSGTRPFSLGGWVAGGVGGELRPSLVVRARLCSPPTKPASRYMWTTPGPRGGAPERRGRGTGAYSYFGGWRWGHRCLGRRFR